MKKLLAQDIVGTIEAPGTIIQTPEQTGSFITAIVVFITVIAGLYALWQFITGGFGYISSSGDKAKVQQSTQQIMMAILGLAVIGASFILGSIIVSSSGQSDYSRPSSENRMKTFSPKSNLTHHRRRHRSISKPAKSKPTRRLFYQYHH